MVFYGTIWLNFDQYNDFVLIYVQKRFFLSILKKLKKFQQIFLEILGNFSQENSRA